MALTWEVLRSHAYRDLKPSSAKALPYFFGRVQVSYNDPARYATDFVFSYTEARRYGFALGTFARVITDLIEKGFVDPVEKGGLRSDGRSFNRFRLSLRWQKYGTEAFQRKSWNEIPDFQKQGATPKMEMYNFKNGTGLSKKQRETSKNRVVEAVFA